MWTGLPVWVPFKTRTLKDALRVNPEFSNTYAADGAVSQAGG